MTVDTIEIIEIISSRIYEVHNYYQTGRNTFLHTLSDADVYSSMHVI